jgi:hypothetical protein
MSQGLGRLEWAIVARIERQRQAHREVHVTAGAIVWDAYPHRLVRGDFVDPDPPPRAHLVAAHRAMHSFVRKHPEFGLIGGKGGWPLELVWRRGGGPVSGVRIPSALTPIVNARRPDGIGNDELNAASGGRCLLRGDRAPGEARA